MNDEAGIPPVAFEGADLLVRSRLCPGSDQLMITFTGRAAKPPVARGFGEDYFAKRGISAIHFISKGNHWWQTAELSQAIAALRALGLIGGPERVTLYGSSMGGFAALIRSRELAADRIITVSPQYSIDGAVVPFEARWRNYAAKLRFEHDDMAAGLDRSCPLWAVVDPLFAPDMGHVRMIEALRPVFRIGATLAGHNTARALEECGLMQPVLRELLDDNFDLAAWPGRYRAVRRRASLLWFGLAETLVARRRGAWAGTPVAIAAEMVTKGTRMRDRGLTLQILRLAIETACAHRDADAAGQWLEALRALDPNGHSSALAAARFARLDDDPAIGVAAAEAALALRADDPAALALTAAALIRAGDARRAIDVVEPGAARDKRSGPLQGALAAAQLAAGRIDDARATAERALRRGLTSVEFRLVLATCALDRGEPNDAAKAIRPLIRRAVADPAERARTATLAEAAGLTGLVEGFLARGARCDRLYRAVRACRDHIVNGDPAGSIYGFLDAVRKNLATS